LDYTQTNKNFSGLLRLTARNDVVDEKNVAVIASRQAKQSRIYRRKLHENLSISKLDPMKKFFFLCFICIT
jgi:hypothetical protein